MDGSNFPGWRFDFEPETARDDRDSVGCLRLVVATVLVGLVVSALVLVVAGPMGDGVALLGAGGLG